METKNIYTALAAFQKEIKPIPLTKEVTVKTQSGGQYTFKYAPLPQIIEQIQPIMEKNKLSFIQTVKGEEIITKICHESGEAEESKIPFPMPKGLDAQKVGSWITYLRRYGLVTALGLVAEEDDDANIASSNQFAAKPYVKPAQKETSTAPQIAKPVAQVSKEIAIDPLKLINCVACGSPYKYVRPGVSKSSGKPYKGFYPCSNGSCKAPFIQSEDVEEYLKPEYKVEKVFNVKAETMSDGSPVPEAPPEMEDLPF